MLLPFHSYLFVYMLMLVCEYTYICVFVCTCVCVCVFMYPCKLSVYVIIGSISVDNQTFAFLLVTYISDGMLHHLLVIYELVFYFIYITFASQFNQNKEIS